MRKLIILILFLTNVVSLFAQNCDDPLCQDILNLRLSNQKKASEIYQRDLRIKDLTNQYEKLSASEKSAKALGRKLMEQISQLNEEKRSLETEKRAIEEKYVAAIDELKKQKELTAAQKALIETYEREIKKGTNVANYIRFI